MTLGDDFENPFDVTRTEYFNTNYSLIADYFEEPAFYQDLIERERFIIVGSRGTGKSMILKSLYLPVFAESLRKKGGDPLKLDCKFIGVYVPCDNLDLQKYFDDGYVQYLGAGDSDKGKIIWRRYLCNYFALYIVREILHTVLAYGHSIGLDIANDGEIAGEILQQFDPSSRIGKEWPTRFEDLPAFFERERKIFLDFVMEKVFDPSKEFNRPIVDLSFIKDVCDVFINRFSKLRDCRFYILLDDFFPPFVTFKQQAVLLDLIRERGGPLSFKITTIPEGITYTTDSGYEMRPELDYSQTFLEHNNVGRGSDYWKLIKGITNKRLQKYNVVFSKLFDKTNQTADDFLKRLRGEVSKGHDRPIYASFNVVVEMSSGVVGTYLLLVREMVNLVLKNNKATKFSKEYLPIPTEIQDKVVRDRSNLFLGSILSLEQGQSIYRLVSIMARRSRERFLTNRVAKEYIQYKIKNYESLLKGRKEAHSKLVVAFRNNVLHSPDSYPTDRQKNVILRTLILNRLLTPALRIPYRDRWGVDIDADEIGKILLSDVDQPLQLTTSTPTSSTPQPIQGHLEKRITSPVIRNSSCTVFSGSYCRSISELSRQDPGVFLSLPFKGDWHKVTEELIKDKCSNAITSLDLSPDGDFICKICEYIHKKDYGIYEISVLNDNVFFEMGLSLGLGKHTFPIWNKEDWATRWCGEKDSPIKYLIDGLEGFPYTVSEGDISSIVNQIQRSIQKNSWNKDEIQKASNEREKVFLALSITSGYYQKYLKGEALKAFEELGIGKDKIVDLPEDFKGGLTLISTFRWILQSGLCVIDSTRLASDRDDIKSLADYVWRMFSLGVAMGLRKPWIHCFNTCYTQEVASDIRGKCTFIYKDLELYDKLLKAMREGYVHEKTG